MITIKRILRKHIKKFIIGIIIILIVLFVRHIYGIFVQPFIDPYFFKISNIEKLIGTDLPLNEWLCIYEIDTEPSYNFGGTKGIKEIYAKVQIEKDTYELFKEKWEFNGKYSDVEEWKKIKNYESLNIENIEEIDIREYRVQLIKNVYHGIFRGYSTPGTTTGIFVILTKEIIDEHDERYFLYVFNELADDIFVNH